MRYRLTALTPVLVGDGRKLAPMDYMVWKDHVNVLNQRGIFQLMSKGPRLDGYLAQLKKGDRLDWATWGGLAQNFADRRIPLEHPGLAEALQRAQGDSLHIPTFSTGASGPYLPGAAIKGALRTALLFTRIKPGLLKNLDLGADRPPRRPAESAEHAVLGGAG
ncbi:MAG: RAMP superfamily CRISPR-associated protein, partial [Bryobacteraceae bacterium]